MSMSQIGNNVSHVKLSLLAQLVVLYAEKGITSTSELAKITGKTDRSVRRAKAEISEANPDARVRRTPESAGRQSPPTRTPVSAYPDASVSAELSPSSLKKKGLPHTPSKEKIHPPPCVDSQHTPFSLVPRDKNPPRSPPVWRGDALVVTKAQHEAWTERFALMGYAPEDGYNIADSECVAKGLMGEAAVKHATRKLGFLASDWKAKQQRPKTEEELREERVVAFLKRENPNYVDSMEMTS